MRRIFALLLLSLTVSSALLAHPKAPAEPTPAARKHHRHHRRGHHAGHAHQMAHQRSAQNAQ